MPWPVPAAPMSPTFRQVVLTRLIIAMSAISATLLILLVGLPR